MMMPSFPFKCVFQNFLYRRFNYLKPINSAKLFASDSSGYDGDGKTIVSIVNEEERQRTLIDSYSRMGFRLNSGLFVMGPVAVFPQMILQWDVVNARDISPRSLSLFWLLEPKIDCLVIGVGDADYLPQMDLKTRLFLKSKNINVEVLPTSEAVATFNFMNVDYRNVAAALIPPKRNYIYSDAEVHDSYNIKGKLFEANNALHEDLEKRDWKRDKHHSDQMDKFIEDKRAEENRNKKY